MGCDVTVATSAAATYRAARIGEFAAGRAAGPEDRAVDRALDRAHRWDHRAKRRYWGSVSLIARRRPDGSPAMLRASACRPPAVLNVPSSHGAVTHSGDPRLARHIGNATVRTDNRGTRIYEEHKHSARRIDLAVCAIMAHSVAATIDPGLQLYWYDQAT
jgi:hypothetical protein